MRQVVRPHWMRAPESWKWTRPDGMTQGFGVGRDDVGLTNLLWLVLNEDAPPAVCDARTVPDYGAILLERSRVKSDQLFQMASLRTLKGFHDFLATRTWLVPLEQRLLKLAERRLHAHT